MPVSPTYPGVYIEEVPSGVRTIAGVSTAVTAFVGYSRRGPVNKPVRVFGFADYERTFGPLDPQSDLGYAVHHYFLNGGGEAVVVRVAQGATAASVDLRNGTGSSGSEGVVLTATARDPGAHGNAIRMEVDYASCANPHNAFSLRVVQYSGEKVVRAETFRELSMNRFSKRYAPTVVNDGSQLVTLARPSTLPSTPSGTLPPGHSTSGSLLETSLSPTNFTPARGRVAVSINGMPPVEIDILRPSEVAGLTVVAPATDLLDALAARIQERIREIAPTDPVFLGVNVAVVGRTGSGATLSGTVKINSTNGGPFEPEGRSVEFFRASTRDGAAYLKLGTMHGGSEQDATAYARPLITGAYGIAAATAVSSTSNGSLIARLRRSGATLSDSTLTLFGGTTGIARPATIAELADLLPKSFQRSSNPMLRSMSASLAGGRIHVQSGLNEPNLTIEFLSDGVDTTADDLGLDDPSVSVNVINYALGAGIDHQAQRQGLFGNDGTLPATASVALGSQEDKTGFYALEKVDYFSLVAVPLPFDRTHAQTFYQSAIPYCERRRAMLLVDVPGALTADERGSFLNLLRHKNAAAYYPRVLAPDLAQGGMLRPFAPSGAVAGVIARTDGERGLWKAPAGLDASLRGVQGLEVSLTEGEVGTLNPRGLNCLRVTPLNGPVVWGARTLVGDDNLASEWKYVPVRRLALYLEESLYRGTQWVVFEPNDEPLWAQVRLNVGAFMHSLFRQGAFQGRTPGEAYLVKCDRETTTQDDINRGIVNIVVGFAPLKPAEFVILKIQQLAGQIGA